MSKLLFFLSTNALAILLAASYPLNIHGFTATSLLPTIPVVTTTTSTASSSELLAHVRRSHTHTSPTATTTTPPSPAAASRTFSSRSSQPSSAGTAAKSVFSVIDKDGNGKIDRNELSEYLTRQGPYTKAVAQSIFDRLDANHDGHLVLEELVIGMNDHQLFSAIGSSSKQKEVSTIASNKKIVKMIANPQKSFAVSTKRNNNSSNNNTVPNKKNATNMKQWRQKIEQKANAFFRTMDADNDGTISLLELQEHFLIQRMQAVAQSTGLLESLKSKQQPSKKVANNHDHHHHSNGVVPWHHSEAAITNLFRTLDVNQDGRITCQDLKEAFVRYPSVRHAFQV